LIQRFYVILLQLKNTKLDINPKVEKLYKFFNSYF